MILEGTITDQQGNILNDVEVTTGNVGTGELFYPYETFPQGYYKVDIDYNPVATDGLFVKKTGFKPVAVPFSTLLYNDNDIVLMPGGSSLLVPALIGLGTLYLVSDDSKKVGAITKENAQTGVIIAGGVLGWIVVKEVFELLGIFKDQAEVGLDNASTDPRSFWNPQYWRSLPAGSSYTRPITYDQAVALAAQIYNAIGWVNDNEEAVKAVFRSLPSRAAASFVVYAFGNVYGADLLSWLRGGSWPQDRLSDEDVFEITQFVNRLPAY